MSFFLYLTDLYIAEQQQTAGEVVFFMTTRAVISLFLHAKEAAEAQGRTYGGIRYLFAYPHTHGTQSTSPVLHGIR